MRNHWFLFILMLLLCPSGRLQAQTAPVYHNPVLWADVPDMDLIRVDSDYYMVSTTMHLMPGGPIMHSRTWSTGGR